MENQVTEDLESKVEEHGSFLSGMGNGKTEKRTQDQICISDRLFCLVSRRNREANLKAGR